MGMPLFADIKLTPATHSVSDPMDPPIKLTTAVSNGSLTNTMGTKPKAFPFTVDRMEQLLQPYQVPPGTPNITHQSFDEANPSAGAVFIIPDDQLETVMTAIDNLVASGNNFPLLEKQTPVIGAVFDLDFKFKCDLPEGPVLNMAFIEKHIRPFVSNINQLYREHLVIDGSVDFIVQQRKASYARSNVSKGEFVCDGFHILAPSLRATPETHTALRKIGLDRGLLSKFEFPVPVLEEPAQWWDASVVRPRGNSWFIFGLGKVGRPAYTTIYQLRGTIPMEEEGGGITYPMKAFIKYSETAFRRKASYAMNKAEPALPIKPECAKVLLDNIHAPKPLAQPKPTPLHSDPGTPATSVSGPDSNDLIVAINKALNLPVATPWQVKEKTGKKFVAMPITTNCLCCEFQHIKPKQSQLIVNASQKKSGKPTAVAQCFDYTNNHGIVKLPETVALQLFGILFNDDVEETDIYHEPTYLAMKEEFEEQCVKICVPVCFNVKIEDEWLSLTEDKLKQLFKNKGFVIDTDKGKERKPFINTWLTDPDMLTYTRFAFYPDGTKCPPTHFNEFKGWAFDRYIDHEPVECPEILEIILALCGGEEDAKEYVLDYMAQLVQEPTIKPGVCLVFGGQQGTGKDFLWDWFRKFVLGDDITLMTAQPETDLFGSFTTRIKNRLLIKLEEGEGKTFHGNSDKFKSFITSPTTTYHPKGIDPTTILFPARFVITTNNFNAVKVEEEDRRYCFFKAIPHAHAQDRTWFGKLATRIGNCETGQAPTEPGIITWFVRLLKSRKITGKNWIADRPKTLQWKLMRTMNMPYHYHFLEWLVFEKHELLSDKSIALTGTKAFKATDLYQAFNDWKTTHGHTGEKNSMTATKFFCLLKEMSIPDGGISSGRNSQGSTYTIKPRAIRKWLVSKNYISNPSNANLTEAGDVKDGCLLD